MSGALKSILPGLIVFLICALIMSFVASIIAYATYDPGQVVFPLGLLALYISSCIGGFVACRKNGGLALLTGTIFGIAAVCTTLLLALLIPTSSPRLSVAVILCTRLPVIGISVLGAYLSTIEKRKKKRHKKR
jgi:putative membrane protein (TIGR04086 family)